MSYRAKLAFDVGKSRVGVARSDFNSLMAFPLETLIRDSAKRYLEDISKYIDEYQVSQIIVGLPLNLNSKITLSTIDAVQFAKEVYEKTGVGIRLIDERLSTVSANSQLSQLGKSLKKQRKIIDQAAAVVILEQALLQEKNSCEDPGTALEDYLWILESKSE